MTSHLRAGQAKFAVLGSPIAHSKSPLIHNAAYEFYGFSELSFTAIDLPEGEFLDFMRGSGSEFAGFAVTMPLKKLAAECADWRSELVQATGVANTLVRDGGQLKAFNTDVSGLSNALIATGENLTRTVILGAGATSLSAGIAAVRSGAKEITILARRPESVQSVADKISALYPDVVISNRGFDREKYEDCDFVISSLPCGIVPPFSDSLKTKPLFDVAYDPWPSALGDIWQADVYSGLEMLLCQAVIQLRIFIGAGDENTQLPDESELIAHLRDKLGLK